MHPPEAPGEAPHHRSARGPFPQANAIAPETPESRQALAGWSLSGPLLEAGAERHRRRRFRLDMVDLGWRWPLVASDDHFANRSLRTR